MSNAILLSLGAASFVLLFVYRLLSLGANINRYRAEVRALRGELPALSVVVPMRNEEANVRALVQSLLAQEYPPERLQLIVVNDSSTDQTGAMLAELSTQHPNLLVVDAPPLPEGWTGKNHACHVGQGHATGQYVCFIDADVRAKPRVLRDAVLYARQHGAELFCLSPMQLAESLGEKLLLSGLFLTFAAIVRPNPRADDDRVSANGQFLLFTRVAYDRMGGHQAVRHEVADDIALGRLAKRLDVPYLFAVAEAGTLTTRMYDGFRSAWKGFRKNVLDITHTHDPVKLAFNVAYVLMLSVTALVLPLLLLLADQHGQPWTPVMTLDAALAAAVWGIFAYYGMHLRLGVRATLFIPFSLLLSAYLLTHSFAKRRRPQAVVWKGRTY